MTSLDHLEELSRKGTKGPWGLADKWGPDVRGVRYPNAAEPGAYTGFNVASSDAALIVALRNSADDLFAAIRAGESWLKAQDAWQQYEDEDGIIHGFCRDTFDKLSSARDQARERFRAALAKLGGEKA